MALVERYRKTDKMTDKTSSGSHWMEYETTVDEGTLNGRYGTAWLRLCICKLKGTSGGAGKGTCLPGNDEKKDTYLLLDINRHKEGEKKISEQ